MQCTRQLSKALITFLAIAGVTTVIASQPTHQSANTTFQFITPANFCWSGPFVGGYIGGAWEHANVKTTVGRLTDASYFASSSVINTVAQNSSGSFTPSAFVGGVQFGGNWMYQNLVYGLVLDYGSLNFNKSHHANAFYPDGAGSYTLDTKIKTDWLYTVRGRLGWAPSPWILPVMIYATGGLAVTKLQVSNYFHDTSALAGVGGSRNSDNLNGWVVGAGIEYPITQNWTINGEYLYARFGSTQTSNSIYNATAGFGLDSHSLVSPFSTSANLYANLFKVGLNYKFTPVE